MKTKFINNRMFKVLLVFLIIISNSPVFYQNAKAATVDDKWLSYKFDHFSQNTFQQLFSAMNAAEVPAGTDFIRLTPATPMLSGAVFNKTALCPVNNYSFSTAFSFKISNPANVESSDGLTFTIQTGTTSSNAVGGGIGYYDIKPSFTVKYDTFLNTVYNDPSSNYIGLAFNGELVNQNVDWYSDLNQYNATIMFYLTELNFIHGLTMTV